MTIEYNGLKKQTEHFTMILHSCGYKVYNAGLY